MDAIPTLIALCNPTDMVTVQMPFRLACAVESALDMARCGVTITDVGHKQQIATAMDLITEAILDG